MHVNEMETLRSVWTFQYSAREVAEGAAAQRDFRKSRQDWWAAKKTEVMAQIRDGGVQISESLADQIAAQGMAAKVSNYGTTSMQPLVTIDPELMRQLAETHRKIDEHRRAVADYDGWVQVLNAPANVNKMLDLTQNDWLYFFGKK